MLYFNISGFGYDDRAGNFYAVGMPKHKKLTYRTQEFNNYEVNSAFYTLPKSYDYCYTKQELSKRLLKIQKLDSIARKKYSFTKNHWHGQAVSSTRQLRVMVD